LSLIYPLTSEDIKQHYLPTYLPVTRFDPHTAAMKIADSRVIHFSSNKSVCYFTFISYTPWTKHIFRRLLPGCFIINVCRSVPENGPTVWESGQKLPRNKPRSNSVSRWKQIDPSKAARHLKTKCHHARRHRVSRLSIQLLPLGLASPDRDLALPTTASASIL